MTMIWERLFLLQMALLVLMALAANANTAGTSSAEVNRRTRVLQRGSKHKEKVKGQFGRSAKNHRRTATDDTTARRELQSSDKGKGKSGEAITSAPGEHHNIFGHSGPTMQVECGSPISPFLTTFVTSVKFHEGGQIHPTSTPGSKGSKKGSKTKSMKSATPSGEGKGKGSGESTGTPSGKGKGKGKSGTTGQDSKYASGDGYYQDYEDEGSDPSVSPDELTREEQQQMEVLFEDVYNQLSFLNCDGFFRTVFTASMTLAPRDDVGPSGEYTVTLDQTMQGETFNTPSPTDQPDATISFGQPFETSTPGTRRRRLAMAIDSLDVDEEDDEGADGFRFLKEANATKGRQSDWGGGLYSSTSVPQPTANGTQTVVGGPMLTIYYVSLTATCRNCDVTPEVNFPLLRIPTDELSNASPGVPTVLNSSAPEEDVCTCPAGTDEKDEAYSRRELQVDEIESLYVPNPRGPTSEEIISAMNLAIARNDVLKQRVEGLVQLIEPDYFDGRNPPRVDFNTSAPTGTAGTNWPTYTPAIATRYPTAAPSGSREIDLGSAAFRGATSLALALAVLSSFLL